MQAYVDADLDLASHFITRLRCYASFYRTLASHDVTAGTGSNHNMVTSPTQSSASPTPSQGGQSGSASSTGSTQMQAWVQVAIAKISSTTDGVTNSTPNPISGPSSIMPISINTGTFPGTPAVRLIGDCHFLRRLCQLLPFFSFSFGELNYLALSEVHREIQLIQMCKNLSLVLLAKWRRSTLFLQSQHQLWSSRMKVRQLEVVK